MSRPIVLFINIAVFQVCWFANALGAAWNYPLVGPCFVVGGLVVHLVLIQDRPREVVNIVGFGLLGYILDGGLTYGEILGFSGGKLLGVLPPIWMLAQWFIFTTLLRCSLGWLRGRYFLGAVLGAGGGPLAFYSATRLGALSFPEGTVFSVIVLAVVWGLITPVAVELAHWQARPLLGIETD